MVILSIPADQKEYVLRPITTSYASVWDLPEHLITQSAPVVKQSRDVLPTTPVISYRSSKGNQYNCAPPYSLVVPIQPLQTLNVATLEHSWAHSLFLALHSIRLAFENAIGGESITLPDAAKQLDSVRRTFRQNAVPPSDHYMANCRTLHHLPTYGATMVSGWRKSVNGEPFVQMKNVLIF